MPIQRLDPESQQMRYLLKRLYRAIPGKQALFNTIKQVWIPGRKLRRHLWFVGPFEVRHRNVRFLIHHYGFDIETSIFWTGLTGDWEGVSLNAWLELCRDSSVIFDVGANTGVYSLVAKAANPAARVFSFEPVPRVFRKLEQNNQLNGFDIHCHCVAASDYDGEADIYDLPTEHTYSVTVNKNMHAPNSAVVMARVKTVRLDNFVAEHALPHVDLMKIDVESHEPEVLDGLGQCLHRMRPTILVEVWNTAIGKRIESIVDGAGYLFFATDEKKPFRRTSHIENERPEQGYVSYLLCQPHVAARLGLH